VPSLCKWPQGAVPGAARGGLRPCLHDWRGPAAAAHRSGAARGGAGCRAWRAASAARSASSASAQPRTQLARSSGPAYGSAQQHAALTQPTMLSFTQVACADASPRVLRAFPTQRFTAPEASAPLATCQPNCRTQAEVLAARAPGLQRCRVCCTRNRRSPPLNMIAPAGTRRVAGLLAVARGTPSLPSSEDRALHGPTAQGPMLPVLRFVRHASLTEGLTPGPLSQGSRTALKCSLRRRRPPLRLAHKHRGSCR
jgi:hypothetical protein